VLKAWDVQARQAKHSLSLLTYVQVWSAQNTRFYSMVADGVKTRVNPSKCLDRYLGQSFVYVCTWRDAFGTVSVAKGGEGDPVYKAIDGAFIIHCQHKYFLKCRTISRPVLLCRNFGKLRSSKIVITL